MTEAITSLIEKLEGAKPCPLDRTFWGYTADETLERMTYWREGSQWAGEPLFSCLDYDGAAYAEEDVFAWTDDRAKADALCAAILRAKASNPEGEA